MSQPHQIEAASHDSLKQMEDYIDSFPNLHMNSFEKSSFLIDSILKSQSSKKLNNQNLQESHGNDNDVSKISTFELRNKKNGNEVEFQNESESCSKYSEYVNGDFNSNNGKTDEQKSKQEQYSKNKKLSLTNRRIQKSKKRTIIDFLNNIERNKKSENGGFKCNYCDLVFDQKGSLGGHTAQKHSKKSVHYMKRTKSTDNNVQKKNRSRFFAKMTE